MKKWIWLLMVPYVVTTSSVAVSSCHYIEPWLYKQMPVYYLGNIGSWPVYYLGKIGPPPDREQAEDLAKTLIHQFRKSQSSDIDTKAWCLSQKNCIWLEHDKKSGRWWQGNE